MRRVSESPEKSRGAFLGCDENCDYVLEKKACVHFISYTGLAPTILLSYHRYLKGWFLLDALSSLPVALLSHSVEVYGGVGNFFFTLKLVSFLLYSAALRLVSSPSRRPDSSSRKDYLMRVDTMVAWFHHPLHLYLGALLLRTFSGFFSPSAYKRVLSKHKSQHIPL